MVGLNNPAKPGTDCEQPRHRTDLRLKHKPQRHVQDDVTRVIAQPVDDLALRAIAIDQPRQIAISPVHHMPCQMQGKAEQYSPGPARLAIREPGSDHETGTSDRHHIWRDAGRF